MKTMKEVRQSFWAAFPQFKSEFRTRKTQNDYRTEIRVSFTDYIDSLQKDGIISEKLAYKITL